MRPIKFRAFRKDDQRWFWGLSNVMLDLYGIVYWQFGMDAPELVQDQKNYVLMQFTGLFDKNGNEIYEGDIISSCPGSGSADAGFDRLIVKWFDPTAGFFFERPGYPMTTHVFRDEYLKTMKVIGNIYENPELLEVQK